MAPRVAIVYYSMYGHIKALAEAERKGVQAAGGTADLFQIQETLPEVVLSKMCAAPPDKVTPFATPAALECYDGFLFGVPTRFGTFPQQWTAFLDSARPQWQSHAFAGKLVGAFVACGKSGSGTEATVINMVPTFVHFGLTFVPAGSIYNDLLHHEGGGERGFGASPWGAGTLSGSPGSPLPEELLTAERQGRLFCMAFGDSTERNGVNGTGTDNLGTRMPQTPNGM